MKSLNEELRKYLNEEKNLMYQATLNGITDKNGMDMSITILLGAESDIKTFEKWAEKQEDNVFSHIRGGNIEY